MKNKFIVILTVLFLPVLLAADSSLPVVQDLDISRYLGVWYEIARLPTSFEKGLVGVTATYTLRDDGNINVLNQGYKNSLDGKLKKAAAIAKIPDKNQPAKLKVYFFLFFGGDYYILDLDRDNYQYALVGVPSRKMLWILSRTPQMDEEIYRQLVQKAQSLGFNTEMLYKTPQK